MICGARIEDRSQRLGRILSEAALNESILSSQIGKITEDVELERLTSAREIDGNLAMFEAAVELIESQLSSALQCAQNLRTTLAQEREGLTAKSERPTWNPPSVQDHGGIRDRPTE